MHHKALLHISFSTSRTVLGLDEQVHDHRPNISLPTKMMAITNQVWIRAVGVGRTTWFAGPITIAVAAAGVVVVADSIAQLTVVVLSASWPGDGTHGSLRSTPAQILVPVTEDLVTREALSRDGCVVQGFQDCEGFGVEETQEVVSVHLPNKSPLE